ncbi:MAG TPA: GFA family protein [Phenylobacterium sp.]|nr:GFA family protein [Phenylobacterium sp.]
MDEPMYEGGCLCGQVRWSATARPANVRVCHCRLCQKATGGPFFARAIFRAENFAWSGEVTAWPTSPRIDRRSCARCGTPMFATPKDPPARVGVSIATCDDRSALAPECHIWVSERAAWLTLDDGLPQFDRGFVAGSA